MKRCCLILVAVLTLTACSPKIKQTASVDEIIPTSIPRPPLSDWTATATRIRTTVDAPGAILRGFTFQPASGQELRILFLNGNAMIIADAQPLYRALAVRGADVTAFDYRGYGFSTGKPDVMEFRNDALLLYDRLAATGPVVVYGFSMGTAMAAYVASKRAVAGLILAGAIASAQEEFPVFAAAQGMNSTQAAAKVPSPDAITAFDEKAMVAQSKAPLLMLHGESDRLVPIQQGREIFAASPSQNKVFVAIPGAAHNETAESAAALQAVEAFLFSLRGSRSHFR
jgi:pimeloyl-ACP methyl ester carboxylesterase